jgi:hypothetical protein
MRKYLYGSVPVILSIQFLIFITFISSEQQAAVQSSTVVVTYTSNDENIPNPERGFFTNFEPVWNEGPPEWTTDNPAITDANCQEALRYKYTVLRRWYVIDWDQRTANLSSAFLQHVRNDFATIRKNGLKMILRFSYNYARGNYNGVSDTDINSVLRHLDQLKPVLQENEDVLAFMEAGFVGYWGEWHHSSNNLIVSDDNPDNDINDNSKKIIDKLLEVVPKTRMVALRLPYHKIQYLKLSNLSINAITAGEAYAQTTRARLGHHDDAFRANFNDWATYQGYPFYLDVEAWKNYMAEENRWVVQSGEPAGTGPGEQIDQSGRACIQDFARLRFSHFNAGVCPPNGNIEPFSSQSGCGARMYETWKADGSIPEMEKRLGYRFQLTRAELPASAVAGTQTTIRFQAKNTGWANPYNPRGCEIVFRSQIDGTKLVFPVSSDPRKWSSGTEQMVTANLALPASMTAGNYDIFLNLPDPKPTLYGRPQYSIRLANRDVWEPATGYNSLLHTVQVVTGGTTPTPTSTPQISFTIGLKKGWNMISLPITPDDTNIANVLSPINGLYSAVHSWNGSAYESFYSGQTSTLNKMVAGKAYWIMMIKDASLLVTGTPAPKIVELNKDWNMAGFNSTKAMGVSEGLGEAASKVTVIYEYNAVTKQYEVVTTLEPGKGYWMLATSNVVWTLP